ncbi:MAG: nitroreductase family protein [Nitrospira sp.]
MEKPAQTEVPIHELLARRWSPRAFDERPVEPAKIASLFEAARWAPSSSNEQPWRFVIATKKNPAAYDRLLACVLEGNRKWAFRAPVLILSVARLNFEGEDKPNRHALHDTGLALENLLLQATALGLVAHPMAGFDLDKARADLHIPPEFEPMAMVAVGYPGDLTLLPEYLQQRELKPRERTPVTEFVYADLWDTPLALLKS